MSEHSRHDGRGRPPTVFTDAERNQVEVLSGIGLPHKQIAALLGISEMTLRKHLLPELDLGGAKATAKVAQTLFNKAMSGDTGSLIFWMKVRAGWREVTVQEQHHTLHQAGAMPALAADATPLDVAREYTALMGGSEKTVPTIDAEPIEEESETA